VVSEKGYGKRSFLNDPEDDSEIYRVTNRGGKGVKTLNVTEKTGNLIAIKNVTDENDLMIINRSGVIIRIAVADLRVMGRATQGVRLINLRKNDSIAAVAKVSVEEEDDLDKLEVADGESGDTIEDSEAPENSLNEEETPSEDEGETE
jgi:DNA gyrase subunit A